MPRRLATLLLLAAVGCGRGTILAADEDDAGEDPFGVDAALVSLDAAEPASDAGADVGNDPDGSATPDSGRARLSATTVLLTLGAGAFPPSAHPSALVYFPDGFSPEPPLNVVVYLHGWDNCVENVIRETGQSCSPDGGTPVRNSYALRSQLESSGKNALLLCPEVVFDQPSGNPGALGATNGFKALLAETLDKLEPQLGKVGLADLGRVVVFTHSGGYQAASSIATRGGVPVQELYLLDSLYGDTADFDAWVKSDLGSFEGWPARRRFGDVYTSGGGTLGASQAMADAARGWFPPDGGTVVDDRTTATWTPPLFEHGALFKHTSLAHDDVPRTYFGKLLQSSALLPKR